MRQNAPELDADASHDLIAQFVRPGQPADVFAALKHLADTRFASRPVSFEKRLGHEPHFLEHPGAVRCDQSGIGDAGEANLEPRRRHEAELLSLRGGRNRLHISLTPERGAEMRDEAFRKLDRVAGGKMRPFGTGEAGQLWEILEVNSGRGGFLEQAIPSCWARRRPIFQAL